MALRRNFRNFISPKVDFPLLLAILVLSSLGLLNLAGVFGTESLFFKKQIIFFAIGLIILFLNPLIDYRIFKNYPFSSLILFSASVFLLLLTLQAAPVRGVTAWLHLPLGFSFETSEIVKLALILLLARYFSSRDNFSNPNIILISGIYAFLVIFLVFTQPDLGSAVILFLIWLASILLFGLTKRQIILMVNFLIIIFLISGFFILQPYQKSRITSFLTDLSGQSRESYNVLQSKIAIGSAGIFGFGFSNGFQARSGILPEAVSDFALAALIEQFGFVAFIIVIIFYFFILNRLFFILSRAKDNFSRFFIFMFSVYFFSHVVINIGMNFGLLPVTGLPLPFISYGGSYFISLMIGFAILQNIKTKSIR